MTKEEQLEKLILFLCTEGIISQGLTASIIGMSKSDFLIAYGDKIGNDKTCRQTVMEKENE